MTSPLAAVCRWEWPRRLEPYAADLGALLAASVADDGILGYADEPTAAEIRAFASGLVGLVGGGDGHVLLGTDEDGLAAMCVMSASSMPNCRHIAEVSKAYLRPRLRGTGIVLDLAARVAEKAAELGVEMLVIDVREGSKAHRVWERLGFVTFGVLPDYSRVDGRSFKGHYMYHSVDRLAEVVAEMAGRRNLGG